MADSAVDIHPDVGIVTISSCNKDKSLLGWYLPVCGYRDLKCYLIDCNCYLEDTYPYVGIVTIHSQLNLRKLDDYSYMGIATSKPNSNACLFSSKYLPVCGYKQYKIQ